MTEATEVVKSDLDVSIEEVTHAVAEISKMDAVIGELEREFGKVIFDVETPKGMKAAREARAKIRKPRYLIEKVRKGGKAPVLELGRRVDGKAKEQTERLQAIEDPIHEAIVAEEEREEREREAAIEAEAARVEGIQGRIQAIRDELEPVAWDTPAKDIAIVIDRVADTVINESFAELEQQAADAKAATLSRLREMQAAAKAREEDEARRKEEQAELERLRAAEERRRAIRVRIDDIRANADAMLSEQRSEVIATVTGNVEDIEIDASFEEFADEAQAAKESTLAKLREMHTAAVKREQAEAKRREELERREREVEEENNRLAEARLVEARRQDVVNQINIVRALPSRGYEMTAAELSRLLARAQQFGISIDEDDADLAVEAANAQTEAISAIEAMLKGRQEYEERQRAEAAEAERKRKAEAAAKKARYPGDDAVADAIIVHFSVTREIAVKWLAKWAINKQEAA